MFIAFSLALLFAIGVITYLDRSLKKRGEASETKKKLFSASQAILEKKIEVAEALLKDLLKENENCYDALLLNIRTLRDAKKTDLSLKFSEEALKKYPEKTSLHIERAKSFLSIDEPKKAYDILKNIKDSLSIEREKILFAEAALLSSDARGALACLESISAPSGRALALLGSTFFSLERYKEAAESYKKARFLNYDTHQIRLQLAHALRKNGEIEEASSLFKEILKKDPEDIQATIGLSFTLQARGEVHKALCLLRSSLAWQKKDPLLAFQAGLMALHLGRDNLAEECFSVASEKGTFPEIYLYHGYSLERKKKYEEAERTYLEMIKAFPGDPRGYEAACFLFAVGFSKEITPSEGIRLAHHLHEEWQSKVSFELLSACEARVGNFDRALIIQESLILLDTNEKEQERRRACLKALRKNLPLNNSLLPRMVA